MKHVKKLEVKREVVRALGAAEMARAIGGQSEAACTQAVPPPPNPLRK